jgi:DNA mismatch repair protein MutL
MPIRVLPEQVASQIAAGEVVERPASAVKELVENAIDAGARDIRVEAQEGGKRLLRVVDDGCGIPAGEVPLAFHRHSTSKLQTADDLGRITTLGFRGEALASIAAVSRVTLETRAREEAVGTLVRLEGGEVVDRRESGRPPGTAVTVHDLFFNVPARRKFLRTERTERRHIDEWLTRYAMAYPELRFTLLHDGRSAFQSPGSGSLRDVLVGVYGVETGAAFLEIPAEDPTVESEIRVTGFVSPPNLHRANRKYISLFVNGRWVQDASLTYAVVQAYHTLLPKGRNPLAVVMVHLPPADVDVNVHPAKAEVRFQNGEAVFRAVQRTVRRTLLRRAPVPSAQGAPSTWASSIARWAVERQDRLRHPEERAPGTQLPFGDPGRAAQAAGFEGPDEAEGLPPLRVVGQIRATYVVAEGPQGLYLIDQHAAHERVLFERMLAEREREASPSQPLLEPRPIELAPEVAGVLEEHLDVLNGLGFEVEPFGGSTLLVRALPALVAEEDPGLVLEDVAAALLDRDTPRGGRVEDAVAREVCKRAAVKAGQVMAHAEMEALIRALEQADSPRTCPHGRPTMIHLSVEQLARQFGR